MPTTPPQSTAAPSTPTALVVPVILALAGLVAPPTLWSQTVSARGLAPDRCEVQSLVFCVRHSVSGAAYEGGSLEPAGRNWMQQLRLTQDDEPQPHIAGPVIGGVLGGALGFFVGGFAGAGIECSLECSGDFAGFLGFIFGAGVGEVLGVAVGAHLGNERRGQLGDVAGASLGVALLGLGLGSVLDAPGLVIATVPVQIGTSVYIERSSGRH